ncbi:hypothetical protein ABT050_40700 [Streptomyces mirabilis]
MTLEELAVLVRDGLRGHHLPDAAPLPTAPILPGKTNLLPHGTGTDGTAGRYLAPLPNPLRGG